jgi:hypothetical protein
LHHRGQARVGHPHGRHAAQGRFVRVHPCAHPCFCRTSDFVRIPDHGPCPCPCPGLGLDRGRGHHIFESGVRNSSLWRSRASLNCVVNGMGGSQAYRGLCRGRSGLGFRSGSADPRQWISMRSV